MPRIDCQCEFTSNRLNNTRAVWIQRSAVGVREAAGVCIFLDGEYYLAQIRAAGILEQLQRSGVIPPLLVAYVSQIDHEIRWVESFCNPEFAGCLADELLPWLVEEFGVSDPRERVLAGLSLTGLSAALMRPDRTASQLVSSQRIRDALTVTGHRISYHKFDGGHEIAAWQDSPQA